MFIVSTSISLIRFIFLGLVNEQMGNDSKTKLDNKYPFSAEAHN